MVSIVGTVSEASWKVVQAAVRAKHRSALPPLASGDQGIVEALRRDAGHVTSLDALAIEGSDSLLGHCDRLMVDMTEKLPKRTDNKSYTTAAPPDLIINYPEVLRWGLEERLLAIAENYLGMPVAYRGVLARIDFPDGQVTETRLWHLDQEDDKIMKIVVYVSDVDTDEGPFEYISGDVRLPRHLIEGSKMRVNDEAALRAAVPTDKVRSATGKRGTVVFTDTCRALHRGKPPDRGNRKTLFYCYNSQYPFRPTYCGPMFPVEAFVKRTGPLSSRQQAALKCRYSN